MSERYVYHEKKCPNCGKLFTKTNANQGNKEFKKRIYCSWECYKPKDPMGRFYNFIDVDENNCWVFRGGKTFEGYGVFCFMDISIMAHQFSYLIFHGELIKGMHIDHLCSNRACANPEHLEQVTPKENIHRTYFRGKKNRAEGSLVWN